jgi:hypothetical protein
LGSNTEPVVPCVFRWSVGIILEGSIAFDATSESNKIPACPCGLLVAAPIRLEMTSPARWLVELLIQVPIEWDMTSEPNISRVCASFTVSPGSGSLVGVVLEVPITFEATSELNKKPACSLVVELSITFGPVHPFHCYYYYNQMVPSFSVSFLG